MFRGMKSFGFLSALLASWSAAEARIHIVSAAGKAGSAGTAADPLPLVEALTVVAAGDTVLMRGGVYDFAEQVTVERGNDGAAGKRKHLFAYPGEKPVLDFSREPYAKEGNPRGLQINGHRWHVRGLEIRGAADNGMFIGGDENIVEACVFHRNRDSGLQISRYKAGATREEWPSGNLILNCESYDNFDAPPGGGENADGFACKLTAGEGNVFRGCVSHHNIDDGWDLFTKSETGPIGSVVIDRCVAYANGTLTDGTSNANGDRNGFKLGGEKIPVAHVVTRSAAFGNGKNGFTWNSNPGAIRMVNNLAFDNVEGNFNFGTNSIATAAIFANNLSFWTGGTSASDKTLGQDLGQSNCWWDKSKGSLNARGLKVTAADFASPLTGRAHLPTWDAAGEIVLTGLRLAPGSKLIDAGTDAGSGLPFPSSYYRGKPDIGAVEEGSQVVGIAEGRQGGEDFRKVAPKALSRESGMRSARGALYQGRNAAGRRIQGGIQVPNLDPILYP